MAATNNSAPSGGNNEGKIPVQLTFMMAALALGILAVVLRFMGIL